MTITQTNEGTTLRIIPISPNDDYMAGEDGKIYSRTKIAGLGKKERVDWYPMAVCRNSKGYLTVTLCHQNKKVTRFIHRLVCMAFHGLPTKQSMQVRHLDGNKENNLPENLAWGTQEENWQDRKAHGHGIDGEKHPMAKLSDEERRHIAWMIKKGLCSQRHASRILGVSQSAIWRITKKVSCD